MKYYLVDFENVNSSGLDGISELSADSRIVLFYTRNSNKIDLGLFNQVRDAEAELSIIEVHHGKQALDIQLASYLGYLIGSEPEDTEYYIISKDKGYQNVQSFWPDRKITLCKNLYDDSVIYSEPNEKKKTSSSSSRGRRKSTTSKTTKSSKANNTAKASKTEEKPAVVPDTKPEPDHQTAAVADSKPAAENKASVEEPAPNAFAEAAAIAKAVVEASKARSEAGEQKAKADAPEKAVKKTTSKQKAAEKPATEEQKESDKKAASDKKKESDKKAASDKKKESGKKSATDKKVASDKQKESGRKASDKKKTSDKQKVSDARAEVNNQIQRILSKENIDGDIINATASFVSKNIGKEGYKQTVYRGIIKEHGQKQGLAIYRLIKDIL